MALLKKKEKEAPESEEAANKASEGSAEGEGEGEAAPKGVKGLLKNKKKLLMIIGGVLVFLIVGGGIGYVGGFLRFYGSEEKTDHAREEGHGNDGQPVYFEMPQILVNLNTGGKQASFIKLTVTLELHTSLDLPILTANLPRLLDTFNTFLREMRATDLYGSAGVYRLREEMLMRANKVLAPVRVKDVLFKELIVQ